MISIVTLSSLSDEKYNALVSICQYVHLQDINNTVECSFQKLQIHSHIYHMRYTITKYHGQCW